MPGKPDSKVQVQGLHGCIRQLLPAALRAGLLRNLQAGAELSHVQARLETLQQPFLWQGCCALCALQTS